MERVLAGSAPAGFCTPAQAFGPDFILTLPETAEANQALNVRARKQELT